MNVWLAGGPETTLGELPLSQLTVVSESDSLATVATALMNRGVSCAVVAEPPLRTVTERDLADAWARGNEADDEVARIATTRPYWVPASASVAEAASMMVGLGIRHLVVLGTAGRPIGVVSMSDLFSVLVRTQEPTALSASFAAVMLHATHVHLPE